ncbi:MarR family winged helix-turn-helix transcriptional regulator [Blastococcus deserti]|uniref:MarR family winged helix-turn-helix transcriptional regulator n=1 Tax=Blastococcus deserti TaxID=2259033 RepID=A0ABW4X6H7_9ACTN
MRTDESDREPVFVSLPSGIAFPSKTYARAFLGLIRAGEQLDRLLDADLRAAHGIGLRGYEVLLHLAAFAQDRHTTMTTLTRQTPLSQSRLSRLVAELETRGLVRRTGDERDSRVVVVSLTDEGLQVLRQAQPTHHRGLEERLFSRLTHDELVLLGDLTSRVLADERPIG